MERKPYELLPVWSTRVFFIGAIVGVVGMAMVWGAYNEHRKNHPEMAIRSDADGPCKAPFLLVVKGRGYDAENAIKNLHEALDLIDRRGFPDTYDFKFMMNAFDDPSWEIDPVCQKNEPLKPSEIRKLREMQKK